MRHLCTVALLGPNPSENLWNMLVVFPISIHPRSFRNSALQDTKTTLDAYFFIYLETFFIYSTCFYRTRSNQCFALQCMLLIFVKVAKPKQPNLQTILWSFHVLSSNLMYANIFQSCHMFFFEVVICKTRLQDIFKVVTCISQTSCYMYLSVRASMPGSLLYLAILSRYFFRSIDVVLQHWEVWHQTESLRWWSLT